MKKVTLQLISATKKRFMVKVSMLRGGWPVPEVRRGSLSTWDLSHGPRSYEGIEANQEKLGGRIGVKATERGLQGLLEDSYTGCCSH